MLLPHLVEYVKFVLSYFANHPNAMWQDFYNDNLSTSCEKVILENAKVKTLLNEAQIAAQNNAMKASIATDAIEKAFIFGKNAAGAYKVSDIILGDPSGAQVDLPATHPEFTAEGGIHNHPKGLYEVPSVGDIYWFMQNNYQNHSFDYYLVNGSAGSTYALVITNQTAFNNFPLTKPPSQYYDADKNEWNGTKDIGIDYDFVYNFFYTNLNKTDQESEEMAMAFIIAKYSTGMGLSKKDANGNFQPIFVKEIEDPNDPAKKIYEKTTDCNLK